MPMLWCRALNCAECWMWWADSIEMDRQARHSQATSKAAMREPGIAGEGDSEITLDTED